MDDRVESRGKETNGANLTRALTVRTVSLAATVILAAIAPVARGGNFSVLFTSDSLGLGSSDINAGSALDSDVAGKLVTSSLPGQGSVLTVQTNGVAGPGSAAFPLLLTITAQTHLDTLAGIPGGSDYRAGVLFISNADKKHPNGKDQGLGVRAFTVNSTTGLRLFDTGGKRPTGRALIEGSKDVSGGTGPSSFDRTRPNGPPHVDEEVFFQVSPLVLGTSIQVLLSKFMSTDIIDLHIERMGGPDINLSFLGTSSPIIEPVNQSDNLWKVLFSAVPGLSSSDTVTKFSIRANDDDPARPSGTAEHFLILGIQGTVIPEPSSFTLAALALVGLLALRRRNS